MIIIRGRTFWMYTIFAILLVLGLGIFGWSAVRALDGSPAVGQESAGAKFAAERLFYFSLIISGILAGGALILYRAARAQSQAAENAMNSRRWMDDGGQLLEERLGSLGQNFYRINRELIETNRRRGIKIEGMNALLAFLVKNFDGALMVINAGGEVAYASNDYLEKAGITRSEVIRQPVNNVLPEIYFPEIISEFGRTPVMLERQSEGRNYHFYDIMDRRGEIAYVVVTPGSRNFQFAASQEGDDHRVPARKNRFGWLFGGRNKA